MVSSIAVQAPRTGLATFISEVGEPRRVDMNAIRTGFLTAVYSGALGLSSCYQIATVEPRIMDAAINGEVKKIDEGAGKITLKHGPAKSLGMDEGMTMVYRVKDPAMLKQVKVGD